MGAIVAHLLAENVGIWHNVGAITCGKYRNLAQVWRNYLWKCRNLAQHWRNIGAIRQKIKKNIN